MRVLAYVCGCVRRGGPVGGTGVGVGSWPVLPCCLIQSFESVLGTPCKHLHFFCGGFNVGALKSRAPSVRTGVKGAKASTKALKHKS